MVRDIPGRQLWQIRGSYADKLQGDARKLGSGCDSPAKPQYDQWKLIWRFGNSEPKFSNGSISDDAYLLFAGIDFTDFKTSGSPETWGTVAVTAAGE